MTVIPKNIAFWWATNPANFPPHEGENAEWGRPGCRYPKMLTHVCTREEREEWLQKHKQTDPTTREVYYTDPPPVVGALRATLVSEALIEEGLKPVGSLGQPLIVDTWEDEMRALEIIALEAAASKPQSEMRIPLAGTASNESAAPAKPSPRRRRRRNGGAA